MGKGGALSEGWSQWERVGPLGEGGALREGRGHWERVGS